MPRIAIGEISHETNTFCPPTTLGMFKDRHWNHGEEIMMRERGTRTYLGGMIEAGERLGVTLIPTFAASTEPWGTIAGEAYETMVGELSRDIQKAMPLDAICLGLHGAGIAEGVTDLESGVLAAVRGPEWSRWRRGSLGCTSIPTPMRTSAGKRLWRFSSACCGGRSIPRWRSRCCRC